MRRLTLCILAFSAVLMAIEYHGTPITVSYSRVILPAIGAAHAEGMPVADNVKRNLIAFDFPGDLFLPTTVIVEAFLVVKIIPDVSLAENQLLDVFCIPQTTPITGSGAWTAITEDMLHVAEIGTYVPETGELFFEISFMLQGAANGSYPCFGVALVPAFNRSTFTISSAPDAISLKCEYRLGAREVTR